MYNNYPEGADTPDAPWNEINLPEKKFNILVSCSISKDTNIVSDNYQDDDTLKEPWADFTNSEYTIGDIIKFAKKCAESMLSKNDYSIKSKYGLNRMVKSCTGWYVDEEIAEQQ